MLIGTFLRTHSAYVHDAFYELLGTDVANISDIKLLQTNVEEILEKAQAHERPTLVQTFYESNGVFKDIVLKTPAVKNIKLPKEMLSQTYMQQRKFLLMSWFIT